ncbi:hypothetical protein TNCV_3014891 [Trichonephila clavipes]|nr:hypothetical protein TNCV_3014891 [Trichonephila clavipes]
MSSHDTFPKYADGPPTAVVTEPPTDNTDLFFPYTNMGESMPMTWLKDEWFLRVSFEKKTSILCTTSSWLFIQYYRRVMKWSCLEIAV